MQRWQPFYPPSWPLAQSPDIPEFNLFFVSMGACLIQHLIPDLKIMVATVVRQSS